MWAFSPDELDSDGDGGGGGGVVIGMGDARNRIPHGRKVEDNYGHGSGSGSGSSCKRRRAKEDGSFHGADSSGTAPGDSSALDISIPCLHRRDVLNETMECSRFFVLETGDYVFWNPTTKTHENRFKVFVEMCSDKAKLRQRMRKWGLEGLESLRVRLRRMDSMTHQTHAQERCKGERTVRMVCTDNLSAPMIMGTLEIVPHWRKTRVTKKGEPKEGIGRSFHQKGGTGCGWLRVQVMKVM